MPRTISVKKTFFFFFSFPFLLPHSEETLKCRSNILVSSGQLFLLTLFPNEWVAQAVPIINAQRGGLCRSICFYCSTCTLRWPKARKCPLAYTVPWRRRWDRKMKTEVGRIRITIFRRTRIVAATIISNIPLYPLGRKAGAPVTNKTVQWWCYPPCAGEICFINDPKPPCYESFLLSVYCLSISSLSPAPVFLFESQTASSPVCLLPPS